MTTLNTDYSTLYTAAAARLLDSPDDARSNGTPRELLTYFRHDGAPCSASITEPRERGQPVPPA